MELIKKQRFIEYVITDGNGLPKSRDIYKKYNWSIGTYYNTLKVRKINSTECETYKFFEKIPIIKNDIDKKLNKPKKLNI